MGGVFLSLLQLELQLLILVVALFIAGLVSASAISYLLGLFIPSLKFEEKPSKK